jgi:hypothetical protein
MTLYIAVDGTDPEALDAADDELIADTVHQLLHEEVLVQDIETVGIVENLESEIEKAVISNKSLQVLADEASQTLDGHDLDPEYHATLSEAWNEAYNALHDKDNG